MKNIKKINGLGVNYGNSYSCSKTYFEYFKTLKFSSLMKECMLIVFMKVSKMF
jgi:hypothetical protein